MLHSIHNEFFIPISSLDLHFINDSFNILIDPFLLNSVFASFLEIYELPIKKVLLTINEILDNSKFNNLEITKSTI